ncbi:GM19004 [Drosophila sechellia]|uniref:GM19004 n=1 Tax=Drosophila sechellia TaxID=7238 RepID=B4I987_DROSE|nr:GM19004 [Drosophila sechellia]
MEMQTIFRSDLLLMLSLISTKKQKTRTSRRTKDNTEMRTRMKTHHQPQNQQEQTKDCGILQVDCC